MKLSEKEKNYSLKQWLIVVWMAVRHPIRFAKYMRFRRDISWEQSKSIDERRQDARKYVDALNKQEE